MAITISQVVNSSTVTTTVSGGTTVNTTTSVSVNAGDLILVGVSWLGTGTLSTPAGWTKLKSSSSGSSRVDVYAKKVVTTAVNTGAFVATTMSKVAAMCMTLRITATSAWEIASESGLDSTNDKNWDIVSGSMQTSTDDLVWVFSGANTNMSTGAAHETLTQSGATFAAFDPNAIGHPQSTQAGGTIAACWCLFSSTGGNGTGALTFHYDYTFVNAQGYSALVRIRENKNPTYVTDPVTTTPAAPCDCPDPVAVVLPTVLDTVDAPETGRDILVDPTTNNLALTETGDLALVTGIDSIAQDLRHRCRTFVGEWFLALDAGLPWFTEILGVKKLNLATVRALLRKLIDDTPGVKTIISLDVSLDTATRDLSISFRVDTDLGELVETLTTPVAEES